MRELMYRVNGQVFGPVSKQNPLPVEAAQGASIQLRVVDDGVASPWSDVHLAPGGGVVDNNEKFWGLWDYYVDGSKPNKSLYTSGSVYPFSMGRSASRSGMQSIIDDGLLAQMHLGMPAARSGTVSNHQARMRDITGFTNGNNGLAIPIVHMMDEPNQKGWTYQHMQQMYEYGKDYHSGNPQATWKYAITINDGGLKNTVGGVYRSRPGHPDGPEDFRMTPGEVTIDVIQFQAYPFRNDQHADNNYTYFMMDRNPTRNQFFSKLDIKMGHLRTYFPHSEFVLVGQSFFEADGTHRNGGGDGRQTNRYVMPHDDSPLWYAEYASQHEDILGVIFWVSRNRSGGQWNTVTGCNAGVFSGFRSKMEQAYNTFIKE